MQIFHCAGAIPVLMYPMAFHARGSRATSSIRCARRIKTRFLYFRENYRLYYYSRLIRRLLNWRIQTRKLYPPCFFSAPFSPSLFESPQNINALNKNYASYIFGRIAGSTTTAGSSVDLLTLEDTDPEAVSSLFFSDAFSARPFADAHHKKSQAAKK